MEIKVGKPRKIKVRSTAKEKEDYGWKDYDYWVRDVYGICDELYPKHNGRVEVDRSIVDVVVALNKAGFMTWACCSGLMRDHSIKMTSGYISFHKKTPQWQIYVLSALAHLSGFDSEGGENKYYSGVYYITGTEKQVQKVWDTFYKFVKLL